MTRGAHSVHLVKAGRYFQGLIGFVIGLVISGIAFTHGYSAFLFGISWVISMVIGVCLHELGHAVACKLAGGTVQYIQLGWHTTNRKPWELHFASFNWHLYSLPFSGRAHGSIAITENYRARQCFYIAGGPLTNLVLLIPGAVFLNTTQVDQWSSIAAGWVGANILLLLVSVFPRVYRKHGSPMANDGLLFWQTLHSTDADIQNNVKYAESFRSLGPDSAAAEKMTLAELLARHQEEPGNVAFLHALVNKLHLVDDMRYPEFAVKLIEAPGLETGQIAEIIDVCLTWQLHRGSPDHPEIANRLSMRLLELADSVTTRGTRGSVLIDIGRIDEGTAMLHEVLAKTNSKIDKSYANIFLALAEKQRGNFKLARSHAVTAEKIDSGCQALKRVSDLLMSAAAVGGAGR